MRRVTVVLLALALAGASADCAAIFANKETSVALASKPEGADVYVDGALVGQSPTTQLLSNKESHQVRYSMAGRRDGSCVIGHHLNAGWIFLDLLWGYGAPVAWLVDGVTGSWNGLDSHSCSAGLAADSTRRPRPTSP